MAGRQRCTDHSVTGCMVCFPVAKKTSPASLPEVPSFPAAEDNPELKMELPAFVQKYIQPIVLVDPAKVIEIPSPIVSAAMRYTEACNLHAKAQADVARLKQELEEANKHEVSVYLDRKLAQEEMAKLIAEAK